MNYKTGDVTTSYSYAAVSVFLCDLPQLTVIQGFESIDRIQYLKLTLIIMLSAHPPKPVYTLKLIVYIRVRI